MAGGVIATGNHPKLMWPGVYGVWGRKYNEHEKQHLHLFDQANSNQAYEELVEVTGFGMAPIKNEGAGVAYDSETQGTVSRFTNASVALGFIVTYEELRDNLYEQKARPRAMANAFSMRQTEETLGADFYTNGFNPAAPLGDGQPLFSAVHPTRSGNQSNLLAGADLSEKALEDAVIQIMLAENSRGLKINLMPESLHVHPNDYFEAGRILKSTLQNDTANHAINVLKAHSSIRKGVYVNQYFGSPNAWFVRTNAPNGMTRFNRQPSILTRDNDFETGNAKAKCWSRYVYGTGDWRAVWGNPGP